MLSNSLEKNNRQITQQTKLAISEIRISEFPPTMVQKRVYCISPFFRGNISLFRNFVFCFFEDLVIKILIDDGQILIKILNRILAKLLYIEGPCY